MTTVTVLYFAALKEVTQVHEESVTVPDSAATVADFVEHLLNLRPELRGKMAGVRVAVDEAFADSDHRLSPGGVVALLPPVCGG